MSSLPPPLWPPPPPPASLTPLVSQPAQPLAAAVQPPSSLSLSPSLLIIAGIIVFVFLASVSIHLLLRLLSKRSPSRVVSSYSFSSSASASARDLQFPSPPEAEAPTPTSDHTKTDALIEALPIFTLASSLASLPKSSPDCAVCLSPFDPKAELRLLPACRHAFHAECIDTWLRSTASCPLCRASVRLPFPPLPAASGNNHSRSFRVEIGSVSRRRNEENPNTTSGRSYSLGSFDYLVEDDIEAVVSRISRMKEEKEAETTLGAPPPPGEHVAELAGEGRGWLRDYVDRIASSASSSFNSLRFSGRWSARWSNRPDNGVSAGDSRHWDVEVAAPQPPVTGDEATFHAIYRWMVGI
ncbi:E3 ubiquitin-protein ligase ATL4 [Carex littledalei]|uniref:E3 ubiquitin-protein ligase ATL4 n=1 Tax=Carex littledalei TaxID=544730 RepID=A0A833RXK7_9POAL|nr:E3 ubiquitin-protein ligase ATL4 [Carex littledalei]